MILTMRDEATGRNVRERTESRYKLIYDITDHDRAAHSSMRLKISAAPFDKLLFILLYKTSNQRKTFVGGIDTVDAVRAFSNGGAIHMDGLRPWFITITRIEKLVLVKNLDEAIPVFGFGHIPASWIRYLAIARSIDVENT